MPIEGNIDKVYDCFLIAFLCNLKDEGIQKAKERNEKFCRLLPSYGEDWHGLFAKELLVSFENLHPDRFMAVVF